MLLLEAGLLLYLGKMYSPSPRARQCGDEAVYGL